MPFIIATKKSGILRDKPNDRYNTCTLKTTLIIYPKTNSIHRKHLPWTNSLSRRPHCPLQAPPLPMKPLASQNWVKRRSNYHEFIWKKLLSIPRSQIQCMHVFISFIRMKMPNYVQFHSHCKTLLSSLRSHLVNGCTKSTEMKHRCSGTQFRATGLGAEIAEPLSLLWCQCHCRCLWNVCCQTNAVCWMLFALFTFSS